MLDVTSKTSEIFSYIKDNLKKIGNPIPVNDVWIAAQAVETASELLTLDQHFEKKPKLSLLKISKN